MFVVLLSVLGTQGKEVFITNYDWAVTAADQSPIR